VTHRDPLESIPSACSLAAAYRQITSHRVDLVRLGAEVCEVLAVGTEWALEARGAADPARFFDVSYLALLADPIGVVRAVYDHFGYRLEPAMMDRMHRWLAENPQGKQGAHRYSLHQFGFERSTLFDRFARYRTWMAEHVRPDPCLDSAVGTIQESR
jgi:hypothetical protein